MMQLLQTLVAILGMMMTYQVTSSEARRRGNSGGCPSVEELDRQLRAPPELDPSFYQYPPLIEKTLTLHEFQQRHPMVNFRKSQRHTIIYKSNNTVCSVEEQQEQGLPLDPCPVVWTLNFDKNRHPQTLIEARCACPDSDGCLGVNRSGSVLKNKAGVPLESPPLGCSEVKFHTKVMRTVDGCNYEKVLEPVAIACACRGTLAQPVPCNHGDTLQGNNPSKGDFLGSVKPSSPPC